MTVSDVDETTESKVPLPGFEKAQTFTVLGTPLLKKGRSQTLVASAPQLYLHAKVYSDEAERHLHAHNGEDHAFFVLSGEATFHDEEGNTSVVGPFSGIMIPRGVRYAFESTGEGNLVALRIGAAERSDHNEKGRVKVAAPTVWTPMEDRRQELSGEVFTGR